MQALLSIAASFAILSSVSTPVAAGWFDDIKDAAHQKVDDIAEAWRKEEEPLRPLRSVASEAHHLPTAWNAYIVHEPIYDGDVLVATTGTEGKPWIMLVHGLGQNGMRDWLSVVPALIDDYQVLLLDLTGFASSHVPKAKLHPTRYAQVLNYVRQQFSSQPMFVVGHSVGGAVAIRYAEQFPEDVRKLLLVDAAGILERTAFVKHSAFDRVAIDEQGAENLKGMLAGLEDFGGHWLEKLAQLPNHYSVVKSFGYSVGCCLWQNA